MSLSSSTLKGGGGGGGAAAQGGTWGWITGVMSLSAFQALTGNETHGAYADPLLTNAVNGIFTVPSISPAKGAGVPLAAVMTDALLVARSLTAPTIGAYE